MESKFKPGCLNFHEGFWYPFKNMFSLFMIFKINLGIFLSPILIFFFHLIIQKKIEIRTNT